MKMKLSVLPCDWGDARRCDIEVLLADTACHLNRLFRTPFAGAVVVKPAPPNAPPDVLYRSSPDEPFVVRLATRNRLWSQFAFQFSHEFCHILSGYERLRRNPNNWFHETFCELASVFTLRRMAERWPTHPPYANWANYAPSLMNYAQERLSSPSAQMPAGVSLRSWLSANEEELRKDSYQRDKNALVAYALLPIFESEPTGWNAIGLFPTSSVRLADYLSNWYSTVDSTDKPFVARVSDALGYVIPA